MSFSELDTNGVGQLSSTRTAYQYDERGFYVGEAEAQLNPMRKDPSVGEYLLPRMCTWTAPPSDSDIVTYRLDFSKSDGAEWTLYEEHEETCLSNDKRGDDERVVELCRTLETAGKIPFDFIAPKLTEEQIGELGKLKQALFPGVSEKSLDRERCDSAQLQISMEIVSKHLSNTEISQLAKYCIDVLASRPNTL